MNKVLFALLILAMCSAAHAESYWDKYQELQKSGNSEALRTFIEKGAGSETNNPDYYVAAANYWSEMASTIKISTKPPGNKDLSISDPKSGKVVGSINLFGDADQQVSKKSMDLLVDGVRKFPSRADLVFGLAALQRKADQPEAYADTLLTFLSTACKDPASLGWVGNKPLPESADQLIPNAVYSYSRSLYKIESTKTDELLERLCLALVSLYPKDPRPYNLLAALADAHGNKSEALSWLKKANAASPEDLFILANLGYAYTGLGQTNEAIAAWNQVIASPDADESKKQDARDAIKKLQGTSVPQSSPPDMTHKES
jgi:hypothetical protein